MDKSYKNLLAMDNYFLYELNTKSEEKQQFKDSLTITLESVWGDADLFVSFEHPFPTADNSEF